MPIKVRPFQSEDHAEWLRLRRALWPDLTIKTQRAEAKAWLAREDALVLVATRPGKSQLAGFAEVGTRSVADGCDTSPVAYLEGWYVDPDARRNGVGFSLIRAAEKWARSRGFKELASDAELENLGAQRAHKAIGFSEVERAVLFVKRL